MHADDSTLMTERKEELKSFFMKVKEESEKAGLKFTMKKLRSWRLVPSLHGKQKGKKLKQWEIFFVFLGSKITADGD